MEKNPLAFRFAGLIGSLILTLAAYFLIVNPDFFHLDKNLAILIIVAFAIVQAVIQLIFFLNVWREKGPPWNLAVFLSTLSILLIIVIFSIWIMHHLDYNMMP